MINSYVCYKVRGGVGRRRSGSGDAKEGTYLGRNSVLVYWWDTRRRGMTRWNSHAPGRNLKSHAPGREKSHACLPGIHPRPRPPYPRTKAPFHRRLFTPSSFSSA